MLKNVEVDDALSFLLLAGICSLNFEEFRGWLETHSLSVWAVSVSLQGSAWMTVD